MQTIIISISQVCYARVLDYRRKFIEAAQRYIDLSYRTAIHDEERMTALKHALICTMLASAGMPAALVKIMIPGLVRRGSNIKLFMYS